MKAKKRNGMWVVMLALAIPLTTWVPAALAAGPMDGIKCLVEEVQAVLQTKSEKSRRLDLIEKATARRLDFREMAQRCLGSTWSTLGKGQKDEFVHVFSQLLKASYANHLDEFVKAKVNYVGESLDEDRAEVRIVILRTNDRIPVSFSLLEKPQGWMIYDMNIEGVSMVSNYRSQFQRAIRLSSYQTLMSHLKAKLKAECMS